MIQKIDLKESRIFIFAILLSFCVHAFWLISIKIVAPSSKAERAKFSRVSFLGPILSSGGPEVMMESKPRSFLEERYFSGLKRSSGPVENRSDGSAIKYSGQYKVGADLENLKVARLVDDAVSGDKLEPGT